MRILVTGGSGFIGSNFINGITSKDEVEFVLNVDCHTYAANTLNLNVHCKLQNSLTNINDSDKVLRLLHEHEITHVVHFAAESHVDNSIASPDAFIKTNINGTFSLLEATRAYKKLQRFHHVSTDEVYGSLGEEGKFSETSPYDPRSPYSASKAASDHLVRAYHHTYGLDVTISNCSNNYGPNQHVEKLIPKIITNIAAGKTVPIYGDGRNVRDWIYVTDHCDAIWTILRSGVAGETYLAGGDCDITNLEIVDKITCLMGVKFDEVVEYVKDRPGHDHRYAIDNTKMYRTFGWIPIVDIQQGLKSTIEFYTKQ